MVKFYLIVFLLCVKSEVNKEVIRFASCMFNDFYKGYDLTPNT